MTTPKEELATQKQPEMISNENSLSSTEEEIVKKFWYKVLSISPQNINSTEIKLVSDKDIEWLIGEIRREAIAEEREKYNELIMAVESKHEGETRHETALRYIKQVEQGSNQAITQE